MLFFLSYLSRKSLSSLNILFTSKVILENLKQKLDRVYIVVSGSCNIVRELIVIRKELSNKNYKYILPPHDFVLKVKAGEMLPMKTKYTVEKHFLVIDTLRRGDAFNTCESMADLFFISNRKVSWSSNQSRGKLITILLIRVS